MRLFSVFFFLFNINFLKIFGFYLIVRFTEDKMYTNVMSIIHEAKTVQTVIVSALKGPKEMVPFTFLDFM